MCARPASRSHCLSATGSMSIAAPAVGARKRGHLFAGASGCSSLMAVGRLALFSRYGLIQNRSRLIAQLTFSPIYVRTDFALLALSFA